MTDVEAEHERTRAEVAAYLREFAEELERGEKVTLMADNDSTTLNPPETVTFGVETEADTSLMGTDEVQTVEFRLEWVTSEEPEDDDLSIK